MALFAKDIFLSYTNHRRIKYFKFTKQYREICKDGVFIFDIANVIVKRLEVNKYLVTRDVEIAYRSSLEMFIRKSKR
jgi:hypothetical protein